MNSFAFERGEGLKFLGQVEMAPRQFKAPFSESDILYLNDAFTTPGIHPIQVDDVVTGRQLVHQVLDSLKWYQDIGYLSSGQTQPNFEATNIVEQLSESVTLEKISEFFLENFYYDFFWVEATQDLLCEAWVKVFEQQLINYHIDHIIPIIVISYEKQR